MKSFFAIDYRRGAERPTFSTNGLWVSNECAAEATENEHGLIIRIAGVA